MSVQKELQRANLVSLINDLMKEIRQKLEDLQICLFLVKEITKDFNMEVSLHAGIEKKTDRTKVENSTKKEKESKAKAG